jgi:hypothetical protein
MPKDGMGYPVGVVDEYLRREFGGLFASPTRIFSAVPITSTVIVERNPERVYLAFVNLSAGNFRFRPEGPVLAANQGYVIANQSSREFTLRDHLVLPAMEWQGFHDANGDVFIVEVVRVRSLSREERG